MTNFLESMTIAMDDAIRTLLAKQQSARPHPTSSQSSPLSEQERELSASLMRVNHVGEVCAQAMYSAQAIAVKDPELKKHFRNASKDEADHLAWTARRLTELDSRQSFLNPVWLSSAWRSGQVLATERRPLQGHSAHVATRQSAFAQRSPLREDPFRVASEDVR